jgi:fructose-bisphosphate aldolase class II
VPVALHLDYGTSPKVCEEAIRAGFTSVMIDASRHGLEKNIRLTRQTVDFASRFGVSVEAKLGGGRAEPVTFDDAEAVYAVPEECARLAGETGIDCLATALVSVHGADRGGPRLEFGRMEQIRRMTGLPLALHGGGRLPATHNRRAVSLGTAKINVGTALQTAFTAAIRAQLAEQKSDDAPCSYLGAGRDGVRSAVQAAMRQFGSSRQA